MSVQTDKTLKLIKFLMISFMRDVVIFFRSKSLVALNNSRPLHDLIQNGISIHSASLASAQCEKYKKLIDGWLEVDGIGKWTDPEGADQRIYGIDRIESEIGGFFKDARIHEVIDCYVGNQDYAGFTLAGKIEFKAANKGSGGGWHRDTCKDKQAKSLAYLTDVDLDSGPFEYIKQSHTTLAMVSDWINYGIHPLEPRISEEKVEKLLRRQPERLMTVLAPLGTVLLADTRGIHRGRPLTGNKSRYALTNYYWYHGKPVPAPMQKLVDDFTTTAKR